jgi:hypothetical protein
MTLQNKGKNNHFVQDDPSKQKSGNRAGRFTSFRMTLQNKGKNNHFVQDDPSNRRVGTALDAAMNHRYCTNDYLDSGGSGYNGNTSIPLPEGCEAQPDATSFRASLTHSGGGWRCYKVFMVPTTETLLWLLPSNNPCQFSLPDY